MLVPMVFVMNVRVRMFQRTMNMFMNVLFGQVQVDANRHEKAGNAEPPIYRSVQEPNG